jgi:phytoene/squalene synthetase
MKPGEPAFKRLKLDEAFDVYRLGNEQEKRWWWRALIEKWDRASPSQRKQYIGEFRDAIASHKKARSSDQRQLDLPAH